MSSVNILGDKELFVSKRAIIRLKKDIKSGEKLEPSDYLQDGYTFRVEKNKDDYNINIMTLDQYAVEENKKLLRQKLKNAQRARSGVFKQQMASLKRSIPDKVYKAYQDLLKVGRFNVSPPDEIIDNVEKYKMQIAMVNGNPGLVSNDIKANNAIKRYFKVLGDFLGIEPVRIKDPTPTTGSITTNVTVDDDTEDEEEPDLVSI
jgi:hypothetical protein